MSIFITVVTHERSPILVKNIDLFRTAWESTKSKFSFDILAWVVLPDHFHMILEPTEKELNAIVHGFKQKFSANYRMRTGVHHGRLWQNRYWDHVIRDLPDMNRHIDYMHYNPVKHDACLNPEEYEHSSLRTYIERGQYEPDWGEVAKCDSGNSFGE
ncbi:MAG: transposase [candidate division Zixibacteria bacterium]|nr:transposase [candidate division Zixibacteria bacterium]